MLIISVALIAVLSVSIFVGVTEIMPDAYTVQAQKIFQDAFSKVEQIRNVTITESITLHVITRQEAVDMWGTPSGTTDLTNMYRQENIYKGLFMMPEEDSLYQAASDWTANWIAATVGKHDIYVIRENFDPFDDNAEATFIHELTHIWQPDLGTATTYDQDKAHISLVEGDASFMGECYTNLTSSQSTFRANVVGYLWSNPLLDDVHPMSDTLWSLSYFPYDGGKTFVEALYEEDGFETINQAYEQGYIPSSTTQILHPDLYFANQTVQTVAAPTLKENTWTLVQTDRGQNHNTYGEYFIQAMLATWLEETVAEQSASGWMGDNFTYYENSGDDFLYTWNIQWATKADARQFSVAFHSMVNDTGATQNSDDTWFANGRYLSITLDENQKTTLIACSTVQAATEATYFSFT